MLKATTNLRLEVNCVLTKTYDLRTIEADNPQKLKNSKPQPNFSGSYKKSVVFLLSELWFEKT